jgi:hypothetical protein
VRVYGELYYSLQVSRSGMCDSILEHDDVGFVREFFVNVILIKSE